MVGLVSALLILSKHLPTEIGRCFLSFFKFIFINTFPFFIFLKDFDGNVNFIKAGGKNFFIRNFPIKYLLRRRPNYSCSEIANKGEKYSSLISFMNFFLFFG